MIVNRPATRVLIAFAGAGLLCNSPGCTFMGGSSKGEQIRPPEASASPKMDFSKISTVAVFPLFPSGQIDEQLFAERLVSELTGEVVNRQSQWKTESYRETLGFISQGNLGSHYKNLQADYNTFGGPGGQMVVSPATRVFLKELASISGADAFLIGSYNLGTQQRLVSNPYTGAHYETSEVCTVRLTLYYAQGEENWWTASVGRAGPRDTVTREISQSLGEYLGKGTLRQL